MIECYLIVEYILGFVVWGFMIDNWSPITRRPMNQRVAAGIALWVVSPVSVPTVLLVLFYRGASYVAGGLRDLYRSYYPTKVKVPEARVVERKS
jgi:hypothetical protein